jgi:hypothetical protein
MLRERFEHLMTIPAVGPITALTWALGVGDVRHFSSIRKAIRYCGLCGVEKRSADTIQRTPLSKQRNIHLQTILIEAAKLALKKRPGPADALGSRKAKRKRQSVNAGLARKIVAYLVAMDRRQKDFLVIDNAEKTRGTLQCAACSLYNVSRLAGDHQLNLLCRPLGPKQLEAGTTAERHQGDLKTLKTVRNALLPSGSGEFLPS